MSNPSTPHLPLLASRNFRCRCGQPVFFRNSVCLACLTALGYDCERGILLPLERVGAPGEHEPAGVTLWRAWHGGSAGTSREPDPAQLEDIPGQQSAPPGSMATQSALDSAIAGTGSAALYKRCLNLSTPASCNWLIHARDPHALCRACRLNRTIPDLTDPALPDNGYLWGRVEMAKRRLLSSLILLGLPVASRLTEDPQRGLMFDFLRSVRGGPHVVTGHHTGLITLNVEEADDAKREAHRKALREPYRTLLGHFRHEVGHYYWDRLVSGSPWMDGFRELFGNEQENYPAALRRNYERGPSVNWRKHFVSAYASAHPWEDWAECWAHYLHMRDTVDTALSFGLSVDRFDLEFTPFTLVATYRPDHPEARQFLAFLNHWMQLTTMLNEMSHSMGQPDFYPFVLPHQVIAKLHFIHMVVGSCSEDAKAKIEPEPLAIYAQ